MAPSLRSVSGKTPLFPAHQVRLLRRAECHIVFRLVKKFAIARRELNRDERRRLKKAEAHRITSVLVPCPAGRDRSFRHVTVGGAALDPLLVAAPYGVIPPGYSQSQNWPRSIAPR